MSCSWCYFFYLYKKFSIDTVVPGITFIISINIDIPLNSLLIASDNKCYELSFVRPIVDFDGHIIAVRCITV
jgi:hypothetical protein